MTESFANIIFEEEQIEEISADIYLISCKIDGKVYVGRTLRKRRSTQASYIARFREHLSAAFSSGKKRDACPVLYEAMRLHGADNFECDLLDRCAPEEMADMEIAFISHFDATNPEFGYNVSDGICMYASSERWRNDSSYQKRHSDMRKQLWKDPDYRQKVISGVKESIKSPEHRAYMSQLSKTMWADPVWRSQNQSKITDARWSDPSSKEQMSNFSKNRWSNSEYKQNHSQKMTEKWSNLEYKNRVSAAVRLATRDPEYQERQRQAALTKRTNGLPNNIQRMIKNEVIIGYRAQININGVLYRKKFGNQTVPLESRLKQAVAQIEEWKAKLISK